MNWRRVVKAIVAFVVVPLVVGALVVVVLATTHWGHERVRGMLVSQVNGRINGALGVGELHGNLFSNATLRDVSLADSSKRPIFTARSVQVSYGLLAGLRGHVVIHSLVIDTPVVALDRQPGARWNFQTLTRPKATSSSSSSRTPPVLDNITIHHGRFSYRRPWTPDTTLSPRARDSAVTKALAPDARRRTERVATGYQRVLDYHDIDARLPTVRLGQGSTPTAVEIAALAMIAEPYRPPVIDIRSLVGTLYASKDSLWWRGARMALPASNVAGDGTIGFHRAGFSLDLKGNPIAVADLRWLNPKLGVKGSGSVRYAMHIHGDTSDFAISETDLRYDDARVTGSATIARVSPKGAKSSLQLKGADLTVAALSTAIIHELFPTLPLKRSGVLNGHIAASGVPSALDLDADVRFDDSQSGSSRVLAKGGLGVNGEVSAHALSVRVLPLQVATIKAFAPKLPLGGIVNGDATIDGSMHGGWNVRGDLTHTDGGERSHITGSGRYQADNKHFLADATLEPLSLVTAGRFSPSSELQGSVAGRVHAEGTTHDIRFTAALRSPTGGTADARGSVAMAGTKTRYDVTAVLDALDARAFSRRAPKTLVNGTLAAKGAGTSPATATATVSANLSHSAYDTFSVERIVARVRTADGVVQIDSLAAAESGASVTARGTLGLVAGRQGKLEFTAVVDSLASLRKWIGVSDTGIVHPAFGRQAQILAIARADSLQRAEALRIEQLALGLPPGVTLRADTIRGVRRDSLAGSVKAFGIVSGNVKELGIDAAILGSGLVARGFTVRNIAGNVYSRNVRDRDTPLTFRADADTMQLAGRSFDLLHAEGNWRDKQLNASARLKQDSLVSYAVLGGYARDSTGTHVVRLDSVRATFDTLVWRLVHPARVAFGKTKLDVDSVELRSLAGERLFANGTAPTSGPMQFRVVAENIRASTILRAMQQNVNGDGTISLSVDATGARVSPTMTGRFALRDATYAKLRAPDVDAEIQYGAQRAAVQLSARDSTGKHVASGTASLPINLAFESVKGARQVEGPLTADVVLDSLSLATLPIKTRSLDEFHGMLAGDAHMRGSWTVPVYTGRLSLRDAGLAMPLSTTGMRVTDALADVRFSHDSVIVDSLVAFAGGRFKASGSVDLSNTARPVLAFAATGYDLRVFDSPRGFVDADGELFASGPLDEIRVSGHGEMKRGYLALKQFRKDLLRVKAPGELSFFSVFDTSATLSEVTRVAMERAQRHKMAVIADLTLVIDRGNYYRNRPDANTEFFTGEDGALTLHLDQRAGDQWAVEFVRIGDGVTFFRTRSFIPARGALTFGTHTSAPGLVQQVGEHLVWEPGRGIFPLQLLTGGTSVGPAVGLESGTLFPMRGRELNGYLTMGRLGLSLLQQSGSSLSGSEAWSGQLSGETGALAHRQQAATALGVVLHDIGTGATKEFALDALSVSPGDVPTELVFGKTGGVRGALVEGGRYVTPDLYVAGQLRFTSGIPGIRFARKFGTVYRLDMGIEPRFLFRNPEELGITHPTQRTGAFGAFLTKMWSF